MTRDDVIAVFRLILARAPNSEAAIRARIKNQQGVSVLVQWLLDSKEFSSAATRKRLDSIPVTRELVEEAYRLILDRRTVPRTAIKHYLDAAISQRQLIAAITQSQEYQSKKVKQQDIGNLAASPGFNAQPKTIYLHIPKTAGKSFDKLAESNYGQEGLLSTSGLFPWHEWQQARLVGGHFMYRKFEAMTGKRLFLSLVRDPVERAISRFNYYKNQSGGFAKRAERGFNHDDFKATIFNTGFRQEFVDNYQCLYLANRNDFRSVKSAFAQDTFIVGHFDQIEDWIAVLADRLGWAHARLPKENVAANSDYMRDYMADNELVSLLKKSNAEDYKLLRFIRRYGVYESSGKDFDYSPFKLPNPSTD